MTYINNTDLGSNKYVSNLNLVLMQALTTGNPAELVYVTLSYKRKLIKLVLATTLQC